MECIIELNWLCKHIRKVRSSQPAILLLNWIKQLFPVSIVKSSYIKSDWLRQWFSFAKWGKPNPNKSNFEASSISPLKGIQMATCGIQNNWLNKQHYQKSRHTIFWQEKWEWKLFNETKISNRKNSKNLENEELHRRR